MLCCDKCPRVFHIQCSGLSRAPEGDEEWYCPVCKVSESYIVVCVCELVCVSVCCMSYVWVSVHSYVCE